MEKPRRRYQMQLTLGADDLRSLLGALHSIEFDLSTEPEDTPRNIVSGGYDSGFVLDLTIDPTITHESWAEYLDKYLAFQKEEKSKRAPAD